MVVASGSESLCRVSAPRGDRSSLTADRVDDAIGNKAKQLTINQGDTYYVHFFVLRYPNAIDLHGTAISPSRFRGPATQRPDARFVKWHYNQCIKAHIRGFAVGMQYEAT